MSRPKLIGAIVGSCPLTHTLSFPDQTTGGSSFGEDLSQSRNSAIQTTKRPYCYVKGLLWSTTTSRAKSGLISLTAESCSEQCCNWRSRLTATMLGCQSQSFQSLIMETR